MIYRDEQFDAVASKLDFDVFTVFRDRQITKTITSTTPDDSKLWVIKAKNIDDDGQGVTHIDNYDVYLSKQKAIMLAAYKYVNDLSLYLTPNMTYNPRVIENVPNAIADVSVAVLIPKFKFKLSENQKAFFYTAEYRVFY